MLLAKLYREDRRLYKFAAYPPATASMDAITTLNTALAGRYELERELGAGGMATVYLARDLRHDRHVALKVLRPELGAVLGPERFLSEIKVTANLQHPNLLALFDSGEARGLLFYVMPFVEGESLRARLLREKQLPIEESVRIAVAVANALEYAHQHGVIHRDLKPENILFQAGQPVIADFGIALAVSNAGGNRITQTGLSLGTPQYMSPEQATGDRVVDGRSDIYSLAAVTYEMLTGEAPHTGNTAQAIIARLLTDKPRSIRSTRPAVPEHVEGAIEHALEKLPADRFTSAREFAEALQGRATVVPTSARTSALPAAARPSGWRARGKDPLVVGLAALALTSVLAAAYFGTRAPPAAPVLAPVRFALTLPDSIHLTSVAPYPAAISPDGSTIAFWATLGTSAPSLWIRRTDQLEPRIVPGTQDANQPLFSPDGMWLAFERGGKFQKVRLDGSAPVAVSQGASVNGGDWTTRDEIILGSDGAFHGLTRVSAAGGELTEFTHPDSASGVVDHLWPIAAPDGENIVFVLWRGSLLSSQLAATNLRDGRVTPLGIKSIRPLAIVDDYLLYVQSDGAVMAVAYDAKKRALRGKPIPVHDPVGVDLGLNGNSWIFAGKGGALVTSVGATESQLSWIAKTGLAAPLLKEVRPFVGPRLSPDERRVAVNIGDTQKSEVWISDLATGTLSRISSLPNAWSVEWMPGGAAVSYLGLTNETKSALFIQSIDGGSAPRKVIDFTDLPAGAVPAPDGRSFLATVFRNNSWDIMRLTLDEKGAATLSEFVTTPQNEVAPRFAPGGKWVALASDESGRGEIYVRSYPDPSVRIQVSVNAGSEPVWSRDGSTLYYRSGSRILAAKVNSTTGFTIVSRDTLPAASTQLLAGGLAANYDVSRDGGRLMALTSSRFGFQLVVVPNWITELRQRVASNAVK